MGTPFVGEGAGTAGGGACTSGAGEDGGAGTTVGGLLPVPTTTPPPDPPDVLALLRGFTRVAGGSGAVGSAACEGVPAPCSPLLGVGASTSGPGLGSATIGVRTDGAVSSVALPAATTIRVGTEVSATSSAE